jgi:hypothetical protein
MGDCLKPSNEYFSYIMVNTSYIQWQDNDVCFVIDQDALFDLFIIVPSNIETSQQVDISLHSATLSWFWANHSLFFLLNSACLAEKQQILIL